MWHTQVVSAVPLSSGVTVSATALVSALAGVIAGGTGLWAVRALVVDDREQAALVRPFVAVAAVLAVGALCLPVATGSLRAGVLSVVPLVTFLLVFVPWNVFAFRYAGRGTLLTTRRLLVVVAVVTALLVLYVSVAAGLVQPSQESYPSVLLVASTLLLGLVALTFVSGGLVLTEAYRHGNVPVAAGVTVVFPIAVLVAGIQVVSLSDFLTRNLLAGLHLLVAAAALPVAVTRYDVLTTRPGTTTLGERTVIEDLDEPVLVVSRDGELILSNQRAEQLFETDLDGRDLADIVGTDTTALAESSTLECWTAQGYRRFDPRVSTVTGGQGRTLGRAVTLIDVTDREMLRQRVQVLNRVFRHNIRNDLDVLRAHAEFGLQNEGSAAAEESFEQILGVTDSIAQMSADARQIERLMRTSAADQTTVELRKVVEAVVESVTRDRPDASVVVEVSAVELSVSRGLLRFALRNLVENAVEHNNSQSPHVDIEGTRRASGVQVVVVDNGPGIPDAEWAVIEAGREESQDHLTSLGLWGTKWAVQRMGGELSRRNREGTSGAAVVIDLPTNAVAG
jgi:signal transduction histidine kinase